MLAIFYYSSHRRLTEIQHVLLVDSIKTKHGQSDETVMDFCGSLELLASLIEPDVTVPASVTRDVTDTKWIELAVAAEADYLVTYDQRHLGPAETYWRDAGCPTNGVAGRIVRVGE